MHNEREGVLSCNRSRRS